MNHQLYTAQSDSATRLSAVITTPPDDTPGETLPLILFFCTESAVAETTRNGCFPK